MRTLSVKGAIERQRTHLTPEVERALFLDFEHTHVVKHPEIVRPENRFKRMARQVIKAVCIFS